MIVVKQMNIYMDVGEATLVFVENVIQHIDGEVKRLGALITIHHVVMEN